MLCQPLEGTDKLEIVKAAAERPAATRVAD
jgi:hypothetical protein